MAVESQRKAVFGALQPIMAQILPAGSNEQLLLSLLKGLHGLLCENETVQKHLGLCFDYVWFPFQYILTSISATRTLSGLPSQQSSQRTTLMPCLASSLVAEHALQCVKRILELTDPTSLPSMLAILAQLAELTHIGPQSGNEQTMHDILSSISFLLKAVKKASWKEHPQEMRIWAVTVGMLFHGLLGLIDAERLGKGYGAPKLATSAMRAAQAAVSALASQPDRAAYYLPGLASNACSVLMDSSGRLPASCHTATCILLQEILLLTLNPETLPSLPKESRPNTSTQQAPLNATAALAALTISPQADVQAKSAVIRPKDVRHPGKAARSQCDEPSDPFTTPRNAAWLQQASESLTTMLPLAIRAARVRKATSVRSATAQLSVMLLQHSVIALQHDLLHPLLQTVLLLSADRTTAVSSPCMKFLHATSVCQPGAASESLWQELTAIAEQAAQDLSSGAAWREESLLSSARLLSAALTALPSFIPESAVVSGPAGLLDIVCKLLEFDLPTAALWLQGHGAVQGSAGSLCSAPTAPVADQSTSSESHTGQGESSNPSSAADRDHYQNSSIQPEVAPDVTDSEGNGVSHRPASTRDGVSGRTPSGQDVASSAAARALQALPTALQKTISSSTASTDMPFGLKRMEQKETFHAVMSVAATTGRMCSSAEPAEQGQASQSWQPSSAFEAVEYVRVEMESAAPRASRKLKDTDNDKLVAGLLQQAQLLTTLSAFLSGCKSGLTGRQAHVHVSRSRVQTSRESLATAADTSTSTAIANDQDSALDKSRKDGTESSTAPSTEASEGKFWKPLTVSLRSIARSASKVMEAGAGTLAALHASAGHSTQLWATSASARDLSTSCSVHAYALSALVDCMGANTGCVLRRDDATLRAVLLPLLQLAAAAPPLVAAHAAAAVTSLCTCLGYAGWAELVSGNLDYVVDGLVLHIRDPGRFPHAPHLLAALLTSSSISQALLPALSEPASAAVQGLSILSRAAHPQHVSAFLAALTPIAAALADQAQKIKHATHSALAALRSRKRRTSQQQSPDAEDSECGGVYEDDVGTSAGGHECEDEGADDGGFKEAAEFFGEYHKPHQMLLPRGELAELDRRRWTTYAAAELSSAITNAAAPLLVSEDLKEALAALSCLTDADDVDTRDIIEGFEVPGAAQLPGEMERILPHVHITWGFIMPGLRAHAQPARLEAALTLIAHVAERSGSFISKRMQTDVLPQLKRIISGSTGVATRAWMRSGGAVRAVHDVAPGTVARCQVIAFSSLQRMCQCSSSREALGGIADELSLEVVEIMCKESTGGPVREQCGATLKGLAAVDQEAVRSALELGLKTRSSKTLQALLQTLLDQPKTTPGHKAILDADKMHPDEMHAQLVDLDTEADS